MYHEAAIRKRKLMSQPQHQNKASTSEVEYLTPEQRLEAVADILATIALRVIKQNHEKDHLS